MHPDAASFWRPPGWRIATLFAMGGLFGVGVHPASATLPAAQNPEPGAARDTIVRLAGTPVHPGIARLELEYEIGTQNGPADYAFTSITSVLTRSDGHFFVRESGTPTAYVQSVRQYDADGRFVRSIGREGRGPGEYGPIYDIALLPDHGLLLLTRGRINVYSANGESEATWNIPSYSIARLARDVVHVDTLGIIHVRFHVRSDADEATVSGITGHVLRMRPGGVILDTIARPDLPDVGLPMIPVWTGGVRPSMWRVPYSPRAIWTFGPAGEFVTAVTNRYAIDIRRAPAAGGRATDRPARWGPGDPVLSIRRNIAAVRIADAERDDRRKFIEAAIPPGARWGPMAEIPRVKPILRVLRVADGGRLWVQISAESVRRSASGSFLRADPIDPELLWTERNLWDVFEPDGTWVGQVEVPPDLEVRAMRGDQLWGVVKDEFDVPYLRKYRVVWP